MKKFGLTGSIISFFILRFFAITCAISNSPIINESSLDIQSTQLFSSNISANLETAEGFLGHTERETNSEASSDENINTITSNDKTEEVTDTTFLEVPIQNVEVTNKISSNEIPVEKLYIESVIKEEKGDSASSILISPDILNINKVSIKKKHAVSPDTKTEDNFDQNTIISAIDNERNMPKNVTEKNAEDIPSFSEWKQKHLEEVEKKEQANFSSSNQLTNTTKQVSGAKLRWKNYASVDCGAKVILANPEAQNTWGILSLSRDEYKLNPCNSRIWFIVELCEAIQVKKIDLANYELFSSSPKDFTVSVSDRFPTRDWNIIGQFTAKDERDVQNFDVNTKTFGKYIKVEIKSHYGFEHYCPLSLFRAYGTSVFEVLQKDDPGHEQPLEDDDDDDNGDNDETISHSPNEDKPGNILSSATDAVISMVKNVAEVLGSKVNKTKKAGHNCNKKTVNTPIIKLCKSPSHYVVCNNCSYLLFSQVFELLSCQQKQIKKLATIPFINKAILNSEICKTFGIDFQNNTSSKTQNLGPICVESFFREHYLGAMCNVLAISCNKVPLNISYQYTNSTKRILSNNLADVQKSESKIILDLELKEIEVSKKNLKIHSTEPLTVALKSNRKSSYLTDSTYASEINPSKLFTSELPVYSELNTVPAAVEKAINIESWKNQRVFDEPILVEPASIEPINHIQQEVEPTTENTVEESIDKFITEINSESTPSGINSPSAASNLQGQKESVFLRLSNRIKALERNMSLSSQYLEELSKRYKKQVEEMQRVLEKTERTLNDITENQRKRHLQLDEKIESLTNAVEVLLAERKSWKNTFILMFFFILSIFLMFCFHRYSSTKSIGTFDSNPIKIQRRNSISVLTKVTPKKKKRRSSDQTVKCVVLSSLGDQEKQQRKRKKKSSNPLDCCYNNYSDEKFTASITSFSKLSMSKPINPDWVEGRKVIEDIPFTLEELDNSTLATLPVPDIATIDPATYIHKATNLRLDRSLYRNGNIKNIEDMRQDSPVLFVNGRIEGVNEETPKKERKGLKKLLKKVF